MKMIYLGTPDFAVAPLRKIVEEGKHEILAVVTQPDRPNGRSGKPVPPPVKEYAESVGLPVLQYNSIRKEGAEDLKRLAPEVMMTCAFGQILSQEILDIAPLGVFNLHASILPEYRGSAPIQWAILDGKTETGVTVMKTDIGVDTGDIFFCKTLSIGENETAGELFDRLSSLAADCGVEALSRLQNGEITLTKQDESRATHVSMLTREHGKINWEKSAKTIHNQVRGLSPWPSTYTFWQGQQVKILQTALSDMPANGKTAGEVVVSSVKEGLFVACGEGVIEIKALQLAGGKKLPATEFLKGRPIAVGQAFTND